MVDIVISVACYNNEDEIIAFAEQLSHQRISENLCLLVSCNSCSSSSDLEKKLNDVSVQTAVYNPKVNLGYLHGCLYGLSEYSRENEYDWAMISNTDLIFEKDSFFEKFSKGINDEDIWCVGPDITLKTTGAHQNPFLILPPSNRMINTWRFAYSNPVTFNLYFWLAGVKSRLKKANNEILDSKFVYAVHGSCFLLRKECIEKIIEVKDEIFMYEEELLVAEVTKANGKKVFFDNNLSVVHNENQVTGTINNAKKHKWFKDSFYFLYKNFYSNMLKG
ncbi:GT2 family glycosyltransferase [Anaerotaenia torta]|uniref:hypothetical protein n=1 Tax=Anaerotaenia torta TaxID=433293 RepID=UPI003D227C68